MLCDRLEHEKILCFLLAKAIWHSSPILVLINFGLVEATCIGFTTIAVIWRGFFFGFFFADNTASENSSSSRSLTKAASSCSCSCSGSTGASHTFRGPAGPVLLPPRASSTAAKQFGSHMLFGDRNMCTMFHTSSLQSTIHSCLLQSLRLRKCHTTVHVPLSVELCPGSATPTADLLELPSVPLPRSIFFYPVSTIELSETSVS